MNSTALTIAPADPTGRRRPAATAVIDRRTAPGAEMIQVDAVEASTVLHGEICVTADTPLTFGTLIDLLRDARRSMHMPGGPTNPTLALLNALEDRVGNPWAGV